MYKTLRFMLVSLLMMLCGTVWADEVTSTFTSNKWSVGDGEPSWTASADGTALDTSNGRGVQFGKNKGSMTLTSNDSFTDVTKVVIVASANGTEGKLNVSVGNDVIGEEQTIENGTANKNKEYVFESQTATFSGNVTITISEGNHSVWIKSITITSSGGTTGPVETVKTVTFINDANWNKVYVWAWNDTENFTGGEWPGVEITPDNDGKYIWSTTGDPTMIIFNDGANAQTADLPFEDGAIYKSQGKVFNATFTTNAEWNNVYAYAWTGDGNSATKFLGEWPGTQLTKDDATGKYTLSFEATEAPAKILFNNGNNGEGNQTEDLDFVNGKDYVYTVLPTYTSIAAMLADITSTKTNVKYKFEKLLVTYVNGSNTFVSDDGQNGFLFYGSNLGLVQGCTYSGSATGQLYTYNGLPELAISANDINATKLAEGAGVSWKTITPADIQNNINVPVIIENAVFVEAGTGKNLSFSVEGVELAVYNNWSIDVTALEAGKAYTLKGIGCIFVKNETTTYQLYLDSFEEYVEPVVDNNYYILGDFWGGSFEDAPQVMTQSAEAADVYTLVSEVTVEGKKYEYKLRQGDNWEGYQLPAKGNYDFVFGTEEYPAGTYTLTFTANITENKLELSVERDALEKAKAEFAKFIAEVEALYNQHKDDVPADSQAEVEQAIQNAKDALNSPNATVESLAQAQADLQAAMQKAQSDALGLNENVTDKFDIELNWISEMGAVTDYKNGNENLKEVWLDTTTDTGKVIHKTVEKLENGTYEVKLIGGALFTGNGETAALQADEEGRVMIYANNVALSIPVKFAQEGNAEHYQLDNVVVSDGKMEIGMEKLAPGSNRHFIQIEKVKMRSNTRQVGNEEGQNAYWRDTVAVEILGYEAYNNVKGVERANLVAATTKAAVMEAIPPFYAAKPSYDALVQAIADAQAANIDVTEAQAVLNASETTAAIAAAKAEELRDQLPAEQNAEITTVVLCGEFNDWTATEGTTMTKGESENVWTMTLDLSDVSSDQKFKLVVNGEWNDNGQNVNGEWIGNGQIDIDAPNGWVDSAYDQFNNLVLYNSKTGYKTYTVTATWTPNTSATEGWTLKFEGKDEKTPVVMNYYSAVFKTNASWDKVYAYAWSGQDPNVTEFLGGWPGKEIGFNEKNNQYELGFEAETMPEYIIFNNGSDEQTENLQFVNQNMYEYYLPVVDFASVYKGQPAKEGDFFIYNVESGLWLQNNEKNTGDWNTRGATGTYGFAFGLRIIDGGWQLDPKFGHNHSMNASNFYLDTNDGLTTWTLTPVVTQDGKKGYYINAGDNRLTLDDNDNLAWNTEKGTVWQLVTREDRINYLTENATSENPLDATFLIMDPSFANENERASSWTWNRAGGNLDDVRWYRNRRSYAVWNCNSFSLTQNIQNVPNGTYSLTFKGFYRDGNKDDVAARRTAGTERFIGKYFINEDKADVMSILEGANDQWIDGLFFYPAANADAPYGHYPDNADGFNRIFQDYPNAYLNAGVQSVVTTKAMTIGLEKLEQNSNDWIAFDDFRLTYLGPVDISAFTDALNAAIAEAEGLNTDNTSAAVKQYLAEALANAKNLVNSQDTDELSQATANLVAAIEAAKTVDVTILQKTVEVAEEGIDVTAANRVIAEAMTADEVNQALYDLRAARKIKSMHMPDIYTGSAPAEGDVYLFNIGTGTFLGTGSDWNTHAAVDQAGIVINMIPDGNRFKFKTNRGNGWLSYNGYVDAGGQDGWVFMPVEGKTNVYNISSSGNDGNLLGYDPNGGTDGAKYWSTIAIDRKGIDNPMNQWKVVTVSERTELMAQANENKPIDATHLIKNASLNRQDGYDMWEKTGGDRKSTNNNNDRSENFGWEFYNTQSMNFGQTITGLRPGIYEVSVQAFYRDGNGNYQSGVVNQGGELLQLAYLYANDEKQPLMNIADPSVLDKVPGSATMNSDFGAFPNWPEEAFEFFETGYYKNTVRVVVNESGSLTIGIAKDEKQNDGDWIVLDNFRLKYLGTEPAEPIETMSIVGDFTGGWPTAEGDWSMAKDMTQSTENPAIWTLHIENFEVVFEEGQTERKYEYKATANHKWGVYQLPADDSNQDWFFGNDRTYKAGVYDLDFTVDTENHTLTLVPTFDEVGSGIRDINAADGNQMIYNLNGQKVTNVKKGLYIVNGKKTIKR